MIVIIVLQKSGKLLLIIGEKQDRGLKAPNFTIIDKALELMMTKTDFQMSPVNNDN